MMKALFYMDPLHLLVLHLPLLAMMSCSMGTLTAPSSRCSDSRAGLPSCDFNQKNCYTEPGGETPGWKLLPQWDSGPVDKDEGAYMYLEPAISKGNPKKLIGRIAKDKTAICVDMSYNTAGNESVPINLYI
ncbi:hypothetical protein EGW08_019871, partial [Elysia chlorotica]